MKVLLAGPMAGVPFFNFPAFEAAELFLTTQDMVVFNPVHHRREELWIDERTCPRGNLITDKRYTPQQATKHTKAVMQWDFERLAESNAIAMLPGWHQSEYAAMLLKQAQMMGLIVMNIPDAAIDGMGNPPKERACIIGDDEDFGEGVHIFTPDDPDSDCGGR